MLDLDYFTQKMSDLCDRLGLTLKPSIVDNYYAILERELSPDLFERGWQNLYADYQGFGLPSPRQFVEAAVGTAEQRALGEWDALCRLAEKRHPCTVTTTAHQALQHVGGTMALRSVSPKERSFLRRDFVQVYCARFDLGEFDGTPVELGQYTPLDFPGQIAGASEVRSLPPGAVEQQNQRRLAQMVIQIGSGPKPAAVARLAQVGGPTPAERLNQLRQEADELNDPILCRDMTDRLRSLAVEAPELAGEIDPILRQMLTPVSTAA